MAQLRSNLTPESAEFQENRAAMDALVDGLDARIDATANHFSQETLERLRKQGKLTVQERLDAFFDPSSSFLELSPLAADGLYDGDTPRAGVVTGVGTVEGRRVAVFANDPTVKGGTAYPMGIKKMLRIQEIARENRLPMVYLVDSAGAYLPLQSEVFADRNHGGRIFYNQARLAREAIPQLAVVLGHCTAGGAYLPAMSDQSIMVKGSGAIFLAGPHLVKAAIGQDVGVEELGGAEMHTAVSGVADYLAEDEQEALSLARELCGTLPRTVLRDPVDRVRPQPPAYDPADIRGAVPRDPRKPVDAREILCRLLDASEWSEFKPRYGPSLLTGFGRIEGWRVGVLANNGLLFSECALKATQFIQLCDAREIPLVFVHNINGFMVGSDVEQGGITKHGAKMVNAVANARVPKITLLVGGSFGAGNYAMCGRALGPRFLFAWPNSRVSVMGGKAAAGVLTSIAKKKAERAGKALGEAELESLQSKLRKTYEEESSAWYATARLWDDGVIDPARTRETLGLALEATSAAPLESVGYGWMRM